MFSPLPRKFYDRDTLIVARELLGKYLVFDKLVGQVTETEAYIGAVDPACHAYRGITARSKTLFGPPGFSYVYFIYGMYHCLNVVTEKQGVGSAVLIRAVKAVAGVRTMQENRKGARDLTGGPGKLCQAFNIDKKHNSLDMCRDKKFCFADLGDKFFDSEVQITPRIGIKVAQDLLWRFVVKESRR